MNAQEPVVYAVTLQTSHAHTGMKTPLSGLFYQKVDGDTTWQLKGRPNNRAYSVDFHQATKGRHQAMATHTGIHQSWDGGETWKVTSGWQITEANSVVIDPKNPAILYCGTPYGFYKTTDDGKTWRHSVNGLNSLNDKFISRIVMDHSNNARLYCSTEGGVFKSEDAGTTWSRLGLKVGHVRVVAQHPVNPDILAVGTEEHGLYFSLDGGQVWERRDTGVLHNTFYEIAFDPQNPDVVYAGGFQTGVYKSTNGGKNWKKHHKGLDRLDIRSLVVVPSKPEIVYAGTLGGGVFRSTDGGQTWNYAGIHHGYVTTLRVEEH